MGIIHTTLAPPCNNRKQDMTETILANARLVLGAEVMLQGFTEETLGAMPGSHQPAAPRVILLVQDKQGYLNLSELLARAWTRSDGRAGAVVQREWLQELNAGLLMLSGAQAGPA